MPGTTLDSINISVSTIIDDTLVKYRMMQDIDGNRSYYAVNLNMTTTLARDLHYGDDKIYLTNLMTIFSPVPENRLPGIIYINGEQIKFWQIDLDNNVIINPIRGVNQTGVAAVHAAGSIVEDLSSNYLVPEATNLQTNYFTFSKQNQIFKPIFTVNPDIEQTKMKLTVYNGATILEYGTDYTLNIDQNNKVSITFTRANQLVDGVKFTATYLEDLIWLNPGADTITDGSGLAGSNTTAAKFVKGYAHNYP